MILVLICHPKLLYLLMILQLSKHIVDDHTSNDEVQADLNTIQTWANKWQVIFRPLKSESMLLSLRSNNENGRFFFTKSCY